MINVVMKKILLLLCSLPFFAQAQDAVGGLFTINGGYGYYGEEDMSVFLPDSTATFSNHGISWGFGIDYVKNKYLFGISYMYFSQPKSSFDTIDVEVKNIDIRLDIGYLAIVRPKFIFGPVLAIGGGWDGLNMLSTSNATAAEIAAQPGREIHLTQNKAVADLGLQSHWKLGSAQDGSGDGFSLGLQVGCSGSYAIGNWNFENAQVTDGPDGFRPMLYARLSVGILSIENGGSDTPAEDSEIYRMPN
jgi:hypothetical protein